MRIAAPAVSRFSDPLRRFTATRQVADLAVMNRKIHFETNDADLLGRMLDVFPRCTSVNLKAPDHTWKFVVENAPGRTPRWLPMSAFSSGDLRYLTFGDRSFVSVDLESREVLGFLPTRLLEDRLGFSSVFIGTVLPIVAAALGLITLSCACVGLGSRCLLVFGPPHSGKTTSAYLATKHGLEFHGDQNTFLELNDDSLTAWGQPWAPAFRPEAARFLPELAALTQRFICGDMEFLCLESGARHALGKPPMAPVGCVFLEREKSTPACLIRIATDESFLRLRANLPFQESPFFDSQNNAALSILAKLPACRVLYGSDPAEAASIIGDLMQGRQREERA